MLDYFFDESTRVEFQIVDSSPIQYWAEVITRDTWLNLNKQQNLLKDFSPFDASYSENW